MTAFSGAIQLRRDTAANWTSNNPTLAAGELGVETDTGNIKIGDGSTAWTSLAYIGSDAAFTPSFTGITLGSGTVAGRITRIGKLVHFRAVFTFGAGSAMSGAVKLNLPVTAAAAPSPAQIAVSMEDAATNVFVGHMYNDASTTVTGTLMACAASASYVNVSNITTTVPMTWTTGDQLHVAGWYTAA